MKLKNLTKYQKSILKEMETDGINLYTNESKDYRCWLQYKDGAKKIIRKDTCNILFCLGYIKSVESVSNIYFVYERTGKRIS